MIQPQENSEDLLRTIAEGTASVTGIEGKEGAAALLGLSPSTLRYRTQKLGIRRPRVGQ